MFHNSVNVKTSVNDLCSSLQGYDTISSGRWVAAIRLDVFIQNWLQEHAASEDIMLAPVKTCNSVIVNGFYKNVK
jgi:hypothetical protein